MQDPPVDWLPFVPELEGLRWSGRPAVAAIVLSLLSFLADAYFWRPPASILADEVSLLAQSIHTDPRHLPSAALAQPPILLGQHRTRPRLFLQIQYFCTNLGARIELVSTASTENENGRPSQSALVLPLTDFQGCIAEDQPIRDALKRYRKLVLYCPSGQHATSDYLP